MRAPCKNCVSQTAPSHRDRSLRSNLNPRHRILPRWVQNPSYTRLGSECENQVRFSRRDGEVCEEGFGGRRRFGREGRSVGVVAVAKGFHRGYGEREGPGALDLEVVGAAEDDAVLM